MSKVSAKCTSCGVIMEIDNTNDAFICKHCGNAIITEKAIKNYANSIINNLNTQTSKNTINLISKQKKEYIDEFLKIFSKLTDNKRFLKICTNFQDQNLDIPYDYFLNGDIFSDSTEQKPYLKNTDTDLPELLKAINISNKLYEESEDMWQNFQWLKTQRYDEIIDYLENFDLNSSLEVCSLYENFVEIFGNLLKFQDILIDCGELNNNRLEMEVFYFFMWCIHESIYRKIKEELNDNYNIDLTLNKSDLIRQLYNCGVDETTISINISLNEYFQQNEKEYFHFLTKNQELVKKQLKIIKNKKYLDELENDSIENSIRIDDIDLMSGLEFEDFVLEFFNQQGFETTKTKTTGDQGVDIIAVKNDYTIAIQAKRYNNPVGNHAIMEAVAGMKYYNANKCMVVTNSTFTKSAIELAKANNVELWDRSVLQEKIENL